MRRAALLPLLIALAAGCGGGSDKAAEKGDRAEAEEKPKTKILVRTSGRDDVAHRPLKVLGTIDPPPKDRRAVLYADRHPYDGFSRVRALRVRPSGAFRVKVRPARDTRYRINSGGVRSSAVTTRVYLPFKLDIADSPSQVTVTVVWNGEPPMRPRRGARVFVYHGDQGQNRVRRRGSAPIRRRGKGELGATFTFPRPTLSAGRVIVCVRKHVGRGYTAYVPPGDCGNRTLDPKGVPLG